MALQIGRQGWIGVGVQTAFQVPAAITDYIPFMTNTLYGKHDPLMVKHATGKREIIHNNIPGKQYSEGDIEVLVDPNLSTYWWLSALGTTTNPSSLGGGVYTRTLSVVEQNNPTYLTITNNRVVDEQNYYDVAVDQLDLDVKEDIATLKAKLKGNFPQTTTSGTDTTTSGSANPYTFRNATFAFGTTPVAALSNTNLAPHEFKLSLKNNTEQVFRHGKGTPGSVANKGFEATGEFMLYFENTTDRDTYYNQTDQAAAFKLTGAGIGGGNNNSLTLNFYQMSINNLSFETGIDNFYAEKAQFTCEYQDSTNKCLDVTIINTTNNV